MVSFHYVERPVSDYFEVSAFRWLDASKESWGRWYDAVFKLGPLVDHLNAVLLQYYQPARYITIDELMIGTRCRVAFLQYMPKKPTRFGIKVWVNSEAKTSYVLCFQVYTGAANRSQENGLVHRVVMDLTLCNEGTLSVCRQFLHKPSTFERPPWKEHYLVPLGTSSLIPGSFHFASTNVEISNGGTAEMVCVSWRDRRDVLALSSICITPQQSMSWSELAWKRKGRFFALQ